jgi:hypothetical protein
MRLLRSLFVKRDSRPHLMAPTPKPKHIANEAVEGRPLIKKKPPQATTNSDS